MTILFSVVAVTFAAFCVWLTVRLVNRRERWAKWTLVGVVGVPVLYVTSFGPACWQPKPDPMTYDRMAPRIYWPIGWAAARGPKPVRKAISWYSKLDGKRYVLWVPTAPSGFDIIGMY